MFVAPSDEASLESVRGAAVKAVSPAKRGRSAATRLDGGEHTRTLLASTAPAYHNILWSTASEKPAHSCARQHRSRSAGKTQLTRHAENGSTPCGAGTGKTG